MYRKQIRHVSRYAAARNSNLIFFKTPRERVVSLCGRTSVHETRWKVHCRITEKRFRGNIVAVHYIIRIASFRRRWRRGRRRRWEEKTLAIARPVSYSPALLGFIHSTTLLPTIHRPGSFFAESKVRRQIHGRPGYMLIRLRLHRRKGVGP